MESLFIVPSSESKLEDDQQLLARRKTLCFCFQLSIFRIKIYRAQSIKPSQCYQGCNWFFSWTPAFKQLQWSISRTNLGVLCCSGSVAGFYQWSRGVQIRANLDLLMDWIQSTGLGDLATEYFQKLSAAVILLATPKETLLQVRGCPLLLPLLSHHRRV